MQLRKQCAGSIRFRVIALNRHLKIESTCTRSYRSARPMSESDREAPQTRPSGVNARSKANANARRRPGRKQQDTHFLCLPIVTSSSVPQLAKSLAYFRQVTCLQRQDDEGDGGVTGEEDEEARKQKVRLIPFQAFRPPGTYHLTLGVMDLSGEAKMTKALSLLRSIDVEQLLHDSQPDVPELLVPDPAMTCPDGVSNSNLASLDRPISPPATASKKSKVKPLRISLTGLSTFPSAKAARVFYAKPQDPSSRLHDFAVVVRQKFRENGLIMESRPLVLHATVGNLRYAVQSSGRKGKGSKEEGQVDAREIIRIFDEQNGRVDDQQSVPTDDGTDRREFLWAENIVINHLAICKLGATKSKDPVLELEYPPIATRSLSIEENAETVTS